MNMNDLLDLFPIYNDKPVFTVQPLPKSTVTQETRRESYQQVKETLGERQRVVLDHLTTVFENGATAKELSNSLYRQGLVPSPERNSVHPRLNELIAKGLVNVVGKKTCQFTNRKVAIYKSNK